MHIYLDDTFPPSIVVNAERLWRGNSYCYFSTYVTEPFEILSSSRPTFPGNGLEEGVVHHFSESSQWIFNDPGTNLVIARIGDYADFLDIYLDYATNHKIGFLLLGSQEFEPIPRLVSMYLDGWEALASAVILRGEFNASSAAYTAWGEHLHRCETELVRHFDKVIAFGKEGRLLIFGRNDSV